MNHGNNSRKDIEAWARGTAASIAEAVASAKKETDKEYVVELRIPIAEAVFVASVVEALREYDRKKI